jgi:hypothetical protein
MLMSRVTHHTSLVTHLTSHVSYYGYMALAAKCGSVYFFDPQPYCAQSIASAVIKNGFQRAFLVPYPVSDVQGKKIVLDKRRVHCPQDTHRFSAQIHCSGQVQLQRTLADPTGREWRV